jgi:hypothetical protein
VENPLGGRVRRCDPSFTRSTGSTTWSQWLTVYHITEVIYDQINRILFVQIVYRITQRFQNQCMRFFGMNFGKHLFARERGFLLIISALRHGQE